MTSPDFSAADAAVAGMTLAMSPRVKTTSSDEMDFFDALKAIRDGKRVARLEWPDPAFYCLLHDGRLCLHKPDDNFYSWIINLGDMTGEDWVVL